MILILLVFFLMLRRGYIEAKKQYGIIYAIIMIVTFVLAILFLDPLIS